MMTCDLQWIAAKHDNRVLHVTLISLDDDTSGNIKLYPEFFFQVICFYTEQWWTPLETA